MDGVFVGLSTEKIKNRKLKIKNQKKISLCNFTSRIFTKQKYPPVPNRKNADFSGEKGREGCAG